MVVIVAFIIVFLLFGLNIYTKHGESVVVPSVKGLQVEDAAAALKKASLHYEVVDSIFLTDGTPGAITDQIPEEGAAVKKNRTIFLTMQAKNVQMVTLPPLKDFSQRQAIATLNSLGFRKVTTQEVPSAYRGIVIDVTYKGKTIDPNQKIPKGDPIKLIVGAGGEILVDSIIDILPDMDATDLNRVNEPSPAIDNSFFQ